MSKVTSGLTMSLDGFIAAPNDGPEHPLGRGWDAALRLVLQRRQRYVVPSGEMTFKVSPRRRDAECGVLLDRGSRHGTEDVRYHERLGRQTSPRRTRPNLRPNPLRPRRMGLRGSPFTFVTDGVQSAVERAREAAGEKNVAVALRASSSSASRRGCGRGTVDMVPVLLGGGVRFFDHLGPGHIELERTGVIAAPGVTHMTFRVLK